MSHEKPHKKRCIVKKLDFENCVVSGIRSRARGKRKLRARITRDVDFVEKTPEREDVVDSDIPWSSSPVLLGRNNSPSGQESPCASTGPPDEERNSPVFVCGRKSSPVFRAHLGSPKFRSKRKIQFCPDEAEEPEETTSAQGSPSSRSADFKSIVRHATRENAAVSEKNPSPEPSLDIQEMTGTVPDAVEDNLDRIEEFTQESEQNIILSFGTGITDCPTDIEHLSVDAMTDSPEPTDDALPEGRGDQKKSRINQNGSPSAKRNAKKNSLLSRLRILLKKRASEKLLWQHQRPLTSVSNSDTLLVVGFWSADTTFVIKCETLPPEMETRYVMTDSRWMSNVTKVKEGSLLRLHPPWQNLTVEPGITVLLNVVCLDVLEESKTLSPKKIKYETVSRREMDSEGRTFYETLLSCPISPYLY